MSLHAIASEHVRGLRRAEYDRMVELGLFENERVELVRGQIVTMSPQNNAHSLCVEKLNLTLVLALGHRARVRCQLPFAPEGCDDSEPEPDFAVYPLDTPTNAHPARALLVVEVADTSLRYDRGVKASLYAEVGVDQYWLVNLVDRVVEVHEHPIGGVWSRTERVPAEGELVVRAFPDVRLRVSDLLTPG